MVFLRFLGLKNRPLESRKEKNTGRGLEGHEARRNQTRLAKRALPSLAVAVLLDIEGPFCLEGNFSLNHQKLGPFRGPTASQNFA